VAIVEVTMYIDVYGREIEVLRKNGEWLACYVGNEGKKRRAEDIHIPKLIKVSEVVTYLADLCHEWSRAGKTEVKIIRRSQG